MDWFEGYIFADAWVLWFLTVIPILIAWYVFSHQYQNTSFAATTIDTNLKSNAYWIKPFRFSIRMIALALGIIALARPQVSSENPTFTEQYQEGIDIVIALDASGSMLAQDFEPDRFEASKAVAQDFVEKRPNDRMGLVIFEGEAYTQCPLTSDNNIMIDLIGASEQGIVEQGTAIGMGLATAVNRLRDSEAKSKVVILLTDGVNTHGKVHPLSAAEMAKEFGIRVYTIGVGTNGKAKTPVAIHPITGKYQYDYVDVEIDEETLKEISKSTGGKYFRATDNDKLANIYKEIDKMEKAKFKSVEYELDLPEKSMPLIIAMLGLLLFELLLSVIFRSIS